MNPSPLSQRYRSLALAAASLVVAVAAGFALSAATAAPASAGTPCSTQVINDWFDDGTIDHTYAKHCYVEAIQHLPRDIHTYSNAADDIRAAMLAAFKKGGGTPPAPPPQTSGNGGPSASNATPTATAAAPQAQEPKQDGLILRAIEWLGPSDAGAVPLPLLILAGVAFLLLAAAGGSLVNRRLQERRLPPPPQA